MRSGRGKTTPKGSTERAAAGAGHAVGVPGTGKRREDLVTEILFVEKLLILLKKSIICKKNELFVQLFNK